MLRPSVTHSILVGSLLALIAAVPTWAAESVALKDDVEAVDKLVTRDELEA
jgi:hypothetical protein